MVKTKGPDTIETIKQLTKLADTQSTTWGANPLTKVANYLSTQSKIPQPVWYDDGEANLKCLELLEAFGCVTKFSDENSVTVEDFVVTGFRRLQNCRVELWFEDNEGSEEYVDIVLVKYDRGLVDCPHEPAVLVKGPERKGYNQRKFSKSLQPEHLIQLSDAICMTLGEVVEQYGTT